MPKNKVDFMLGHTPSGNDLAYFTTDVEKLKDLYVKYLPYITFEKEITVRSIDTKDEKRLAELEEKNESLEKRNNSLNQRLDYLTGMVEALIGERETEMEELQDKNAREAYEKIKQSSKKK